MDKEKKWQVCLLGVPKLRMYEAKGLGLAVVLFPVMSRFHACI